MTAGHIRFGLANLGLACALHACAHPRTGRELAAGSPRPTPLEAKAAGCYRLLAPVRGVAAAFSLRVRHGRGTGPEALGRLIRPRGGYNSAHWGEATRDTLELVWTSAPSDSTASFAGAVIYMDALRARVTLAADTLQGRAVWRTDFRHGSGDWPSYDFRATRVACTDSTSR